MLRTAHWDFPRTAQELVYQMKYSFIYFLLKPFSGHTQKNPKLASSFAFSKQLRLKNTTIKTPSSFDTRKKPYSKDPRSFHGAYWSYPSHSQAWQLVSTTPSIVANRHH
jgi:hypothetical protein